MAQSPNGGPNDGSLPADSSLVKEYILDDDDCPLAIMRQHNRNKGTLSFHIRRRPHDYQPRKRKKKPKPAQLPEGVTLDRLPYLQEIRPSPGTRCDVVLYTAVIHFGWHIQLWFLQNIR